MFKFYIIYKQYFLRTLTGTWDSWSLTPIPYVILLVWLASQLAGHHAASCEHKLETKSENKKNKKINRKL